MRLIKIQQYSQVNIAQMNRATLFIHMEESAGSAKIYQYLTELVSALSALDVPLYVLPGSIVTDDLLIGYGGGPGRLEIVYHGVGETFWIKDGQVVDLLRFCTHYAEKATQITCRLFTSCHRCQWVLSTGH